MTRDNVAPGLEFVTLQRAARMTGLDEQEVLDLAAIGDISAGIIATGLACHAVPRVGGSESFVSDGRHELDGEFVRTRYHVVPKEQEAHTVDVFLACGFWEIGGHVAEMARADDPLAIRTLWPKEDSDLRGAKPFMPWEESVVMLEKPHTITRADLRFVTADVELVSREHGTGTQSDMSPAGRWPWGDHETELLRHLADAAREFWSTYDPDDDRTAPKSADVEAWLVEERGVGPSNAKVMARLLRPPDVPTGPR